MVEKKRQTVAILNKGKDNKFLDNTFEGFDVGIQDEGEGTLAKGNKFHGVEKYVEDIKDLPLWLKYALAVFAIVGTLGTIYGAWGTYRMLHPQLPAQIGVGAAETAVSTSTINISDIFSRYNDMDRAIDQQKFLKDYLNIKIAGVGSFDNISGSFNEEDGTYYLHLTVSGGKISCQFNNTDEITKRKLDLLRSGSRVNFLGTFTGSTIVGSERWFIRDCVLAN